MAKRAHKQNQGAGLKLTKTIPLLKKMRLTERQLFGLENPIDPTVRGDAIFNGMGKHITGEIDVGHHREIGPLSTLLTVDLYTREDMFAEDDLTRPEWHASLAFMQGKMPTGQRVLSSFSAWSDEIKEKAILECKVMLKGRGQGQDIWLGKPSSLHLFRAITDEELALLPYLPTYLVVVHQDEEC